jgi:hypothetical protein
MRNKKKIISILLVVMLAFSFTTFATAVNDTYIQAHKGCCSTVVSCEQGVAPRMWLCCFNTNPAWMTVHCHLTGNPERFGLICRTCGFVFQWA